MLGCIAWRGVCDVRGCVVVFYCDVRVPFVLCVASATFTDVNFVTFRHWLILTTAARAVRVTQSYRLVGLVVRRPPREWLVDLGSIPLESGWLTWVPFPSRVAG